MKKFWKEVYEVYRPLRLALLGVICFIAVGQVLNLLNPYLQSKIIDGIIARRPLNDLFIFAGISFLLMSVRVTVYRIWRERYELYHIDGAIPERMQEFTLSRLFNFSIGQHTSENSGIKRSVIQRGETALENMMQLLVYQALPLIAEVVILTGILLYSAPPIGWIVLGTLAITLFLIWKLNTSFRSDFKEIERKFVADSKLEGEIVQNLGLIMMYAQEKRAMKERHDSQEATYKFLTHVWVRFINWAALRDLVPIIARFTILLFCIRVVYRGEYTMGQLVMFVTWTTNALGNVGEMSGLHRQLIRSYNSIRRYFEMLSIEPDVKIIANPVRPPKFAGRIEFKNVTFKYAQRDVKLESEEDEPKKEVKELGPALDDVSFIIEAGQTVAFVGESGAGKSTLVNALIRAQDPTVGQIVVDGNDLRVLDLKHFRESLGIVTQETSLFDQTLRYNITYGLNGRGPQVTDLELREIAEQSRINRFYDRLEKGFDTIIGERGVKLSGGERQRVGIARALVKEPDILIFDEATSSLDSENEAMIRESIESAARGRTTIIIAHRFSTIRNVDKVFVFDKGKLVGEGTHNELAQTCEHYKRLVRNQQFNK